MRKNIAKLLKLGMNMFTNAPSIMLENSMFDLENE